MITNTLKVCQLRARMGYSLKSAFTLQQKLVRIDSITFIKKYSQLSRKLCARESGRLREVVAYGKNHQHKPKTELIDELTASSYCLRASTD